MKPAASVLAWLLLLLAACAREQPVQLRWVGEAPATLERGEPFTLQIVRSWPEAWRPAPFDPAAWAPFELEVRSTELRARGAFVEEVHDLRVRCWSTGEQTLRFGFAAFDPEQGEEHQAEPLIWTCAIQPALPADAAPRPEFPEPLPLPRSPWGKHPLAAASVLAAYLLLLLLLQSTRRRPPAARPASWDPWDAFAAIQLLPQQTVAQRAAARAAIRELLRQLEPGRAWGGAELAQRLGARFSLPETERATLMELLRACEASLFAREAASQQLDRELDELAEVLHAVEQTREAEA